MSTDPQSGSLGETRPFKALSPGTLISHYKIIEKIGAGGMGVVYKALDTKLERTVALKFLPEDLLCDGEAKERFEHEAKAASALSHPNITTIYEIDEADGRCFIAMEYIDGKSVKESMEKKEAPLSEILEMATQIAEGLNAAHSKEIVHRDIKPANVMLTSSGTVKIMDFGLAKLKGTTKLTKAGTTMGTLPYMSPEQAGGKDVDGRSDIFSLGVMLYEIVAGRLPFRGDNEAAIIRSIVTREPEPLARYRAGVSEGLQHIITKALAKDPAERYQHADELLADLKHEMRITERAATAWAEGQASTRGRKSGLLRFVTLAAIAAAVVIIYWILEPFRVEVGPKTEAVADENSIAIMYFENVADPEDTDKTARMLTSLLITDLSESQYMSVVSRQRLYDILNLLGKEDLKVIDKTVASEVANRAGVRWILTGEILQLEPNMVVTADISEAADGKIRATQRVVGEPDEDIFMVVDKLSKAIKADMSLPDEAAREVDQPVGDAITHSEDAYRYYMEGWDYIYKHYIPEARESLRKALEHDSTFAMAYWSLARFTSEPEKSILMDKAVKYADKASPRERMYITAMAARHSGDHEREVDIFTELIGRYPDCHEAHVSLAVTYRDYLGEPAKAIPHLRKALEINPLYKEAYNQLAYTSSEIGDLDQAVWAINEYIALAPGEANPYDSRGDLYAYNGRLGEAVESYRRASAIKPGFSTWKEGAMHLFKREYAAAESCFKYLASSSDKQDRALGRLALATVPLYEGRLDDARKVLELGIGADEMEEIVGFNTASKYRLLAQIYVEKGDFEAAMEAVGRFTEMTRALNPNEPGSWIIIQVYILIEAGEIIRAAGLVEPLRSEYDDDPLAVTSPDRLLAVGLVDDARGNIDSAIELVSRALELDEPRLYIQTMLAEMYMKAGRLGEAVGLLETALRRYDPARSLGAFWNVRAYYLLGRAYEESGWDAKAIEQYETFLDLWKDADPGIAQIDDARRRVARLKATSK
jgi:tetratricopeptide (TPR) repeat protein/predicted Ser/Thr protein kinase